MEESMFFLISYLLLWVVSLCSVGMLIYLFQLFTKQNQYIEEKLKNISDMNHPPPLDDKNTLPLGAVFPMNEFIAFNGETQTIYPNNEGSIVLFTSPTCSACKDIYPDLNVFQQNNPHLNVTSLMFGEEGIEEIIQKNNIAIPVVALKNEELDMLQTFMFPVSYFIDGNGKILAKGITNKQEHLYDLINMAKKNVEEGVITEKGMEKELVAN